VHVVEEPSDLSPGIGEVLVLGERVLSSLMNRDSRSVYPSSSRLPTAAMPVATPFSARDFM
jgi:hypothetical protein